MYFILILATSMQEVTNLEQFFLLKRMTKPWNNLPKEIALALSINNRLYFI